MDPISEAPDGRAGIDAALVRRLIAEQFPRWRALPVTPVAVDGWDNRTYRLGEELSVRLPTAAGYAPAVRKEHRWLPVLAPSLPVPIPQPIALGEPGQGYDFPWSVRRWLPGRPARFADLPDPAGFARALADFVLALQRIDATDGPPAGAHSSYRGAELSHYDDETRTALAALTGRLDGTAAAEVWDAALATEWDRPPVWFHGDLAAGNLLVRDGRLAAVIDFGTSGVGDPACDLVIAWTFFDPATRAEFADRVGQDDGTWARARGWALWKALIGLAADPDDAGEPAGRRGGACRPPRALSYRTNSSEPSRRRRTTHDDHADSALDQRRAAGDRRCSHQPGLRPGHRRADR